jgi:hypothetical protein
MAINTYTPKQKQEVNSILNQSDIPDSYWDRLADMIKRVFRPLRLRLS